MTRMDWQKYGIDIPYGRTSGQIKTFCPNCRDRRTNKRDRSLSCNLETGMFHCHYCGFEGCAAQKDESWKQNTPLKRQKPAYKRPTHTGKELISDRAKEWFKSRKISEETLKLMKITEGMEFMPQKGKEVNTVQFNYYLNGELVNTKFRTGDKCFKLVSGAELIPYNIDAIKDTATCVITEGEFDTLSFVECGRMDVVSVPNGANANLTYLDDFIESHFENKDTIFIASDTDTKGVLLRDELIRRFGVERCRIVEYGEGCKDANEHLIKYGKESLLQCLENAPEPKVEGIFTVSDFENALNALYENGMQRGFVIGHENFDKLCSFETKRLAIITGIPGSGKSEWIDEIAERLNIKYDWRFAFFSPENAPLQYHASKLIEKFTGKKFDRQHLSYAEYSQAKEYLEKNFFFISPEDDFTIDSILDKAKFLVRRKGIKVLVIDPYNRVEHNISKGQTETQAVSKFLDRLTNFAQRNDVLVILMAHPAKMPKNKDGIEEVPTLYDISGSANFFNKADFGIVVHRNRVDNIVEVHVRKVKFRHLGECGKAEFKYNLNNGRYIPFYGEGSEIWDNGNHLIEKFNKESSQESFFNDFPDDFPSDFE